MNDKRNLFAAILLALLLSLSLAACQTEEPEPTLTPQAADQSSVLQETNTLTVNSGFGNVRAEGSVEPLRSANLSFPLGGIVAEILTEKGADVSEGDPLMRL
ncbi:MAG: hypothetical protein ACK2UJ_04665, partial [Candidatus Promineifilaceae bacterium]